MARPQVCTGSKQSVLVVLLVVTDQMGRWGRNETSVQRGCSVKLVRVHLICCAKRVVRAKLALCYRGLLLFGSGLICKSGPFIIW